ncbi:MAG: aminodeoxychorismate synthase, component I [Gemmatales bacterium]|nr:MAG: aminodeoxychorismate synthase, component I [Gemmatales bacterium]
MFSYDLGRHLERLPRPRYDEFQVPALAVGLYDWVVAFDHNAERAWMIATGFPELHPTRRRSRAQRRLAWFRRRLATTSAPTYRRRSSKPVELQGPCFCVNRGLPGLLSNFDRPSYLAHVRRAVEHVHAGDCFQVNLAQRLLYPASLSAENVYERLRHCSPAFFAAYFDLGDYQLASSSPERFLCLDGNQVQTFPIKGTRPRGTTPAEDERLMEELSHSPKDRAENIMIVDLLRNDLGRVCQFGSVSVPAVCRLETFRDVHHLVSEVRGTLRADRDGIDLLQAAFPGGSITGAPKIRAMQIIAELEPHARGAYCGSLGFLGFNGTLDTNILIRTMTIGGGWIQFHVGGGIVADSIPENEYEETWHKARGLIRAIR